MKKIYEAAAAGAVLFGSMACGGETDAAKVEATVVMDGVAVLESPSDYSNKSWQLEIGEKVALVCLDTNYVRVEVGGTDGYVEPFSRIDGVAHDTLSMDLGEIRDSVPPCDAQG
ncbi:MAG: hypothetical protein QG553_840 [Patescibacteria group bacterium]|nr:hypothetical protein [Patescibacteria group bacterium]